MEKELLTKEERHRLLREIIDARKAGFSEGVNYYKKYWFIKPLIRLADFIEKSISYPYWWRNYRWWIKIGYYDKKNWIYQFYWINKK